MTTYYKSVGHKNNRVAIIKKAVHENGFFFSFDLPYEISKISLAPFGDNPLLTTSGVVISLS